MKTEAEIREEKFQEEQTRFEKFTSELAKLSTKYGVALDITGGVYIYEPEVCKDIVSISYSDDSSSGDMSSETIFKNGEVA
jgi:hypothetical protein